MTEENQTQKPQENNQEDERFWAAAAHVSAFAGMIFPFGNIIGPGVIFATKKRESKLIADNAREALNFQISISLYVLVAFVLFFFSVFTSIFSLTVSTFFAVLSGISVFTIGFLLIADFILTIIAAIKAYHGETFRYPLTIRFIKG